MAQAHSFWLIIDGAVPTSFRARLREDLLPTLHQLQRTQPGVRLVWFEGGRSWDSPEAAREARELRRREARGRKPTWRPGGNHEDPREKYKLPRDEKRARFKKRATFERQRSEGTGSGERPFGKRPFKPFKRDERRDDRADDRRTSRPTDGNDSPKRSWKPARPRSLKPASPWKARSPWKPKGPRRPRGKS